LYFSGYTIISRSRRRHPRASRRRPAPRTGGAARPRRAGPGHVEPL